MDVLNTALQPVWDFINIFRAVFILGFVGMGVMSAFYLGSLVRSLVTAGSIVFIAISLSSLMPGLTMQVMPYLYALAIGFGIGGILKWAGQRTLNNW